MPTILFVDHAAALGGAEHSLLMLMRHLTQWQPHLATVEGKLATAARAANIPVHIVPLPKLRKSPRALSDLWQGADALAIVARRINAAALHSNTIRATTYAALAAKLAHKPFIWHMRDFWLSEMPPNNLTVDNLLKQALARSARLVIANSNTVKQALPHLDRVRVVHNGIETSRFKLQNQAICRTQLGLPADVPIVGMMGRLRPWKGQMAFLQMAGQVRQTMPNAHFVLIGGNPFASDISDDFTQQVHTTSKQLGLTDNVTFTGQLSDVRPALAALDVFVHPGNPEPFGLVNIEAMAMGKPVVAFAHGALPEIVTHEQHGLLVPPHDVGALATAVVHLLKDSASAKIMGQRGREHTLAHFDVSHTARHIETLYREVL